MGLVSLDVRGYKKEESSEISQACLANGPAHQFIECFLFLFHHEQVIRDKKATFCDGDLSIDTILFCCGFLLLGGNISNSVPDYTLI